MKKKSTNPINNPRTCIVTRKKLDKNSLIRITKTNDKYELDLEMNKNGRGFYLTDDSKIIELALSRKIIKNKFKLDENQYKTLEQQLREYIG